MRQSLLYLTRQDYWGRFLFRSAHTYPFTPAPELSASPGLSVALPERTLSEDPLFRLLLPGSSSLRGLCWGEGESERGGSPRLRRGKWLQGPPRAPQGGGSESRPSPCPQPGQGCGLWTQVTAGPPGPQGHQEALETKGLLLQGPLPAYKTPGVGSPQYWLRWGFPIPPGYRLGD